MRRLLCLGVSVLALGLCAPWRPAPAAADVTFTKDIAPILNAKCVQCHRPGEVAPMPLRTYDEARPYARAIRDKVASRQMPPWFADRAVGSFSNDPSLTDKEIATIAAWADNGAPQGNPADAPKPPSFTDGWQLGEPDYILELPEVHIPATGRDYFPTPNLTLDIKEDHWVRAIEVRPSNREVTHHTVIFAAGNPMSLMMGGQDGFFDVLAVWAVGTAPTQYPEGTGRWIHKGEMLRTNLHYHPNGTPQVDRTRVGFYFGKGELKKEVVAGLTGAVGFQIPPQATNQEVHSVYVVDQDIDVVSLFPHMHLRGKDMTITANYPDGRREPLLVVPQYDFNWQLFYYPKTKLRLPRATRIEVVAHYDNSSGNKHNPDPTRTVHFGETSNDEMMFGMFEFTAPDGVSPKKPTERSRLSALVDSFPKDTAFSCDLAFGPQPTTLVLHMPRTGDVGHWYIPEPLGNFNPMEIQQVKWDGNRFSFVSLMLAGGRTARGYYDVTGTLEADGAIHGVMTRRGAGANPAPPLQPGQLASYEFSGSRQVGN
jgi:hypothetical protein